MYVKHINNVIILYENNFKTSSKILHQNEGPDVVTNLEDKE